LTVERRILVGERMVVKNSKKNIRQELIVVNKLELNIFKFFIGPKKCKSLIK